MTALGTPRARRRGCPRRRGPRTRRRRAGRGRSSSPRRWASAEAIMPARTSPEPAVARAAGPGLGRTACSTLTQAVAVPLVTTTSSEPPSAQTISRAAASWSTSEAGPRARPGWPTSRPSSPAVRGEHERARRGAMASGSSGEPAVGETREAVEPVGVHDERDARWRAARRRARRRWPLVTRMPGPTSTADWHAPRACGRRPPPCAVSAFRRRPRAGAPRESPAGAPARPAAAEAGTWRASRSRRPCARRRARP